MTFDVSSAIGYTWEAVGVVWLASLPFSKRTVRAQNWGSRTLHLALALLGFMLLGSNYLRHGWLGVRFLPQSQILPWAGWVLTVAGCGLAIWARITLGSNWSGMATVKANHELIVSGPYALMRHPIYSGLLLGCVGTALAGGELRCIAGILLVGLAFAIKIGQEERLMMETFPRDYSLYRHRVKALLPGVF
jgi:protein-S-isoprenylcysteine O-methyltransferase Ste14